MSDMKGGLLTGRYAVTCLQRTGFDDFASIVYACNPDEEIGSPFSGPHIRELATQADACFVLEGARENGDIVSARKGVADVRIRYRGRAAHAGVEPERGRSATLQAAHATIAMHALNGRWPGVTVNVGVIAGGTRPNVVAPSCELQVDLRAVTAATFARSAGVTSSTCRPAPALSSSGVPVAMTRPWSMTTMSCASWSASSRYWVVRKMVTPSATSSRMIDHIVRRLRGSNPVVGSSRKMIRGLPTSVIARSSFRRIPPE